MSITTEAREAAKKIDAALSDSYRLKFNGDTDEGLMLVYSNRTTGEQLHVLVVTTEQ